MNAQASPSYGDATKASDPIILKRLIDKYGKNNVVWPLVLSKDDELICYYYERNKYRKINTLTDHRPISSTIPSFFIDYTTNPRIITPSTRILKPFIDGEYSCSYEYIVDAPDRYSTVDLDYAWQNEDNHWRGLELTTYWTEFTDKDEAERLVRQINRRPSWQGPAGAHAFRRIVAAAKDLNIEYYFAFANTVARVGSALKTNGNIYYFRLNNSQIDRLERGEAPTNPTFCSFNEFLEWL